MKRRIFALSVLLLLFLWGCAAPGRNPAADPKAESNPETAGESEAVDPSGTDDPVRPEKKEYVWDGQVEFLPKEEGSYGLEEVVFEILSQTETDSNLLISPYSLRCVLTSLYHTAEDGEAKAELAAFLGYDGSDAAVYEEQGAVRQEILKERPGIELFLADSFWVREMAGTAGEAAEEVKKALKESYGCEVFPVEDFGPETVRRMNGWVEEQTRGMIREIVDSLSDSTILVLINTLYFNGTWQTVFEPKDTVVWPFYGCGAGDEGSQVPFMTLEDESFSYWKGDGYEALELPYGEAGEIVMDVILADEMRELSYRELFASGGEKLKEILAGLDEAEPAEIHCLMLPKWEEDYSIDGLTDAFMAAGLKKVFESGDWSRISEDVRVSSVLHKTAIEVTEHGTKAAAVSAIVTEGAALIEDAIEFIADHNFAYVIREKSTGTLLFVGLINQLSE